MPDVSASETIAAAPDELYRMVSDVTRMGEWSPETTSCRWIGGAAGPAPGARFRGTNKRGFRRWSTTCTVTDAEPGKLFGWDVSYGPVSISHWQYEFESDAAGTRVTESWTDHRPKWMHILAPTIMGVRDQAGFNREGMQRTLSGLKSVAESAVSGQPG